MKFRATLVIALLLIGFSPIVSNSSAESAYEFDTMGNPEVHTGPGGKGYINFKLNNEDNTQNGAFKFEVNVNRDALLDEGINLYWEHTGDNGGTDISAQNKTEFTRQIAATLTVRYINLTIEGLDNAEPGSFEIEIIATHTDQDEPEDGPYSEWITVVIDETYGIELSMAQGSVIETDGNGSVDQGSQALYMVKVKNTGNADDDITLELQDYEWESGISPEGTGGVGGETYSVEIDAFESVVVQVKVSTVGENVEFGEYDNLTLIATSGNNDEITTNMNFTTVVRVRGGVDLDVSPATIQREPRDDGSFAPVNFNFDIFNKWSEEVTVELVVSDIAIGWDTPEDQSITVQEFTEESVTMTITPQEDTVPGSYSIKFNASVSGESDTNSAEVIATIVIKGDYNIYISTTSSEILISANKDEALQSYIKVENRGGSTDIVSFSYFAGPGWDTNTWTIEFSGDMSLEAGEEKWVNIIVRAPEGSETQEATLTIVATSLGSQGSFTSETTIDFRVSSGLTDETPEETTIGGSSYPSWLPLVIVGTVLLAGIGGSSVYFLKQKSKGAANQEFDQGMTAPSDFATDTGDEWGDIPADYDSGAAAPAMDMPDGGGVTVNCSGCQTPLNITDPRRPISVQCPSCAATITLEDEQAAPAPETPASEQGVTVACPTCQTQLMVSDPTRPITVACPGCQTQLRLD
ncbi:MAG: hypothetical protein BEU04_00505 [Marine Group III euryarchaeote CG-Bathy1]|uniref:CARDB domain-containing protein n=1 Tax=Marine Group III euryarchaeote CG-Bathy1 TaxID=1889001 RepID=A0A1J5TJK3_9ARCH|nr:MAG: hypothetical protein BEU04_00505 [Marine Group III euryarchaeote CG-Bathy1]